MIAVRALARDRSDARASAASLASDPYDEYHAWIQREDRRNMTRINETVTRHRLGGTSFYDDYVIRGAGLPFERLFFQTRDALDKVTEELAYERKDRDYELECHIEWMDFDCIDALIIAEHKLPFKCRELQHAQDEIAVLRMTVQEFKNPLSV